MKNKQENTQRVLDNHGNITQNGDIIEFKNSKIENINNILIQNLENSIIELQYNEGVLKNEKQILIKLLSLNNHNFDFIITGLNHIFENKMIIDILDESKKRVYDHYLEYVDSDHSKNPIHPNYVSDMTKNFSRKNLSEMKAELRERGFEFDEKDQKAVLVKKFRKQFKKAIQ